MIQFGSFVFPHNPEKISVSYQPVTTRYLLPDIGEKEQILGKGLRQVLCSGVFFGENVSIPQNQWKQLLDESCQTQLLYLPGIPPFFALLKNYQVDYIKDGGVLPYSLLFIEEGAIG